MSFNVYLRHCTLKKDKQGKISLVKNPVKHINIRYHFICDYYHLNKIMKDFVQPDKNVVTEVFIKSYRKPTLQKLRVLIYDSLVDNCLHFGLCLRSGHCLGFGL